MSQQVWDAFASLDQSTRGREAGGRPDASPSNAVGTARYPVGLGYNNVGRVIAVGDAAHGLQPGDRVFSTARHEQVFDVEPWEAWVLPDEVSDDDAVFAYLATLGLHALRRGGWTPGEPLVVLGLGVIGFVAALTARALGCELTVVDVSAARLTLARSLLPGATVLSAAQAAELPGPVAGTLIDAAGGAAAIELGMRLARPQGRIVVLALHPENLGALLGGYFYEKELSLVATTNDPYFVPDQDAASVGRNVRCILSLIASGKVSYRSLITNRTAASDAARAFQDLDTQDDGHILGSVLDWTGA